jgi:hypothetical protein
MAVGDYGGAGGAGGYGGAGGAGGYPGGYAMGGQGGAPGMDPRPSFDEFEREKEATALAQAAPPVTLPIAPAEPAPPPLVAAPARTSVVEGSTTTTMRPVVTAQDRVNQAQQDQLTEDAAENERKAGEVRKDIAQGQSDHADSEAVRLTAEKEEQRRILTEGHEEYDRRLSAYHDRVEAHQGLKFHDYFSNERGGNKVVAAIMAGLGAEPPGPTATTRR